MKKNVQPSQYRCVAAGIEGFIQQVAVSYLRTGHFFYVAGTLPPMADGPAVDAKLIHKYGVDVSRWMRALRKARGEANLQYIRLDRFFLIMATHGKSLFFELEGEQVSDCRRRPIKIAGYSISYRGGHPHVRIDLDTYLGYKSKMVQESLRRDRKMLEQMLSLPMFVPYAPVRRQLWHVYREMNRVRSAAGLAPLREECLNLRRRIVRPFGDLGGEAPGISRRPSVDSTLGHSEVSNESEWNELDGPALEEPKTNSLSCLSRLRSETQGGAKPVEFESRTDDSNAGFQDNCGSSVSRGSRNLKIIEGGANSPHPVGPPGASGQGCDPKP